MKALKKYSLGVASIVLCILIASPTNGESTGSTSTTGDYLKTSVSNIEIQPAPSNPTQIPMIQGKSDILDAPDFKEALFRMYQNGLTKFYDPSEYKPFETLTREQAAKMFSEYTPLVFPTIVPTSGSNCAFKDINKADPSLKDYIIKACNLTLLQGSNGNFNPQSTLTKAQALAVIIRMSEGKKLDESMNPRWLKYYEKAKEIGLIKDDNSKSMEEVITRYEFAFLLYRFKIKTDITNNMNITPLHDELIATIKDSVTSQNSLQEGKILIDINSLKNEPNSDLFIDIFGTKYKVTKKSSEKYLDDSFVRYGDITSLDTNKLAGTITFTVINGQVFEGYVRPYLEGKSYYYITATNTPLYYMMKEKKLP